MKKKLAIIGNGMAAGRLLDELFRRNAGTQFDISVFGEERHGCYNRILLGRVLAGGTADEIMLKATGWYADRAVTYHSNKLVTKIDSVRRRLTDSAGEEHAYDVAVIATGSAPSVPPMEGLRGADGKPKPGAFLFRTIDDCSRMRDFAKPPCSAVVLGGGLLGLEAAKALSDMGLHVTVVHRADWLMNLQVDRFGGEIVRRGIEKLGIFVRTGQTATGVIGDDRVHGVALKTGEVIPADMLVIAAGIRPRVDLAQASNIPVKHGIVVNDLLATAVPGVYSVGECAEHNGLVYGIVPPIWEQCDVVADVLTGANPAARYRGSKQYTKLKVAGVDVASMGLIDPQQESDEVLQVMEDRRGIYRKMVVRDSKLVGAICVGDGESAPSLARWFDRGDELPPNRLDILCSGDISTSAADREICNCHHVTESCLVGAIKDGCTSLPMLSEATKAGTGCGSCRGQLTNLIMKHAKATSA
ncbi:FAD-dependent oxidoreductase [Limnoglobus roseus]|uniref:NAD(P)/FAD-dependent oxidoreductase n=1 Tax=Limnoglobus roseus TaxID=2598579 RepID=A0A5C1A578_9BACT|nr:FAD-dependent oxidoreductase [Limnoglobus roseus]QEL13503.1 NAD(P)/FAD-dependent oxidoreductase [Limnoglobus roseus]